MRYTSEYIYFNLHVSKGYVICITCNGVQRWGGFL
jgi:hypothetical protein